MPPMMMAAIQPMLASSMTDLPRLRGGKRRCRRRVPPGVNLWLSICGGPQRSMTSSIRDPSSGRHQLSLRARDGAVLGPVNWTETVRRSTFPSGVDRAGALTPHRTLGAHPPGGGSTALRRSDNAVGVGWLRAEFHPTPSLACAVAGSLATLQGRVIGVRGRRCSSVASGSKILSRPFHIKPGFRAPGDIHTTGVIAREKRAIQSLQSWMPRSAFAGTSFAGHDSSVFGLPFFARGRVAAPRIRSPSAHHRPFTGH